MKSPVPGGRLTAIQLRVAGDLTARLLCGGPFSIVSGDEGEIALLPPGRVAAYLVARRRKTGLYVFRTARGDGGTVIPGVSEPVRLFLSSGRRGTAKGTNVDAEGNVLKEWAGTPDGGRWAPAA